MKSILLIISVLLFIPFIMNSQDSIAVKYTNSIKVTGLKTHLETLASDEYEGRESGERGQKMAANYISNHFYEIGLKPFNFKTSYLQHFVFRSGASKSLDFQSFIQPYLKRKIEASNYYFETDFEIINEKIKLVWLGHGFDYSNVYVKDKIVMVWLETPNDSILNKYGFDNSKSSEINSFEYRKHLAKAKGAKGIFFVHSSIEQFYLYKSRHKMMSKINKKATETAKEYDGFPTVYFQPEIAKKLLRLSQKKFDAFLKNRRTRSVKVILNFQRGFNRNITENVIGILPGTTKKHEYIFVTAHYDHLGIIDGRIYNGADDNGSGTSALLTMAETFVNAQKAGFSPERNIVFVAFSGEELGLLGSEFLTQNLNIPHAAIHAVYNIDMIGRGQMNKEKQLKLYVVGEKKCHDKNEKITKIHFPNIELDYTFNDKNHSEKIYYRSDHYNFARFGVDFIYYTTGLHENYHLPSDDSERINYKGLELVTQLVFMNIWNSAFNGEL